MQKWMYIIREDCNHQELNTLGDYGWELVAMREDYYTHKIKFYFKRPVTEKEKS